MPASTSSVRRILLASLVAGATMAATPFTWASDTWPNKPITLVVPFPPGSSPDLVARTLAEPVSAALGQPIIIENKAGAGGNIGTRQVAQATPDGYSILFTINGPLVTAPRLYQKTLGYDPIKDLAPISLIATSPNVLVVNNDNPSNNVQEFVALAKDKNGALNYGSVGAGSAAHLAMEMFKSEAKADLLHVPYSGFPQVISAIMAGDVHSGFMVPAIAMPQVNAGKAKALAVTSLEPSPLLPGIEPVAKQGMPGFEAISWQAVLAPAGTPDAIVQRLNQEFDKALKSEKVQQLLAQAYFSPVGGSPEVLARQIKDETKRWTDVIDALQLSLD